MDGSNSSGTISGVLTIGVVSILLLALVSCLSSFTQVKTGSGEAEVKANLNKIQVAVERYGTDHQGEYPAYLIGGAAKYAAQVDTNKEEGAFTDIRDCADLSAVSDPLLREGYLKEYPQNPFIKSSAAVHDVQCNLPSSSRGDDPLRNAYDEGKELGTRFGPQCNLMGSVLADPRYASLGAGSAEDGHSWADIEYEFWDMWTGEKPLPFLPGMFLYKSAGKLTAAQASASQSGPVRPAKIDCYILAAYGSIYEKGKDILGDEQQVSAAIPVWPWTRSKVSSSPADRQGSPYGADSGGTGQIDYGNPNGIRDALVLVLTAGS
jgi:hypothetical protein